MNFEFDKIIDAVSEKIPLEITPDFVRPVCVVSGGFYEMGIQYGRQQYEELRVILLHSTANLNELWKNKKKLAEAVTQCETAVAEISPESLEMWHGIADGAELPYSAIAMIFMSASLSAMSKLDFCSTISAWGDMTKGELLAGTNADGLAFTTTNYSPVLLMFPTNGNALISNGGILSNLAMNEKGMVSMASAGGWNGLPDDVGAGIPGIFSTTYMGWKYDNAYDAINAISRTTCVMAENLHAVDKQNGAYVLEHTHGHQAIRRSGDHNETDFLITTNHFLTQEMQSSRPGNDEKNRNSYSRYQTEMQALAENYGNLTIEKLGAVLALHDRYDENGWHKDEWDEVYSFWTPEKHGPFNKTYMQTLAVPEKSLFYIRQGQKDWRSSSIPGCTGNFTKFLLRKTPLESVSAIEQETILQLWKYVKKTRTESINEQLLNQAKTYIWYGKNYKAQSMICKDRDKEMNYLSKAVLNFSKAQSLLGIAL